MSGLVNRQYKKCTGQGREAGCKLIAGLDTRIEKLVREISGPCINSKELTTIYMGGLREDYKGPYSRSLSEPL